MAVFQSSSESSFSRDVGDLWRLLTEETTAPRWLTSSRPVEISPDGDLRLGSTIEMELRIGPLSRTMRRTVSEFAPPRRLSIADSRSTLTIELKEINEGTRVTIRRSESTGGVLGLARTFSRMVFPVRSDPVADLYLGRLLRLAGEI